MRRTHVSPHKQVSLRDAKPTDNHGHQKPRGLWYEVNAGWRQWCRENEWTELGGQYLHRLDLADCNVLKIATVEALDAFHARYGYDSHRYDFKDIQIAWDRVTHEYDGLEIAPYQWNRRLHMEFMWCYGWDCASGVIWTPRNASLTLIRRLPQTQPKDANNG